MAIVDLSSGGSPTYVLGPSSPTSQPDDTETLVRRLEDTTGLVVLATTESAEAARWRALEIARELTKRPNVIACRGATVEPGTRLVSHGDVLQALRAFKQDRPAAFLIEVVQASANACVPPPHYFQRLRAGCDEEGVMLVIDETQSGLGRTGSLLAIEREKVSPDLVALSLATAPGSSGGVVLGRKGLSVTKTIAPLAVRVLATLEMLERDRLLVKSKAVGKQLQRRAHDLLETRRTWVMDTRGRGMLHALSLWDDAQIVVDAAAKKNLVVSKTGRNGLLLAPPLTSTEQDIDETLALLDAVFAEL